MHLTIDRIINLNECAVKQEGGSIYLFVHWRPVVRGFCPSQNFAGEAFASLHVSCQQAAATERRFRPCCWLL